MKRRKPGKVAAHAEAKAKVTAKAKAAPVRHRQNQFRAALAQPPAAGPRASDWHSDKPSVAEVMQTSFAVAEIKVGARHRKDLGDVAALARDIDERGLLQPVVVDRDLNLIAGERRLAAWQLSIFRDQAIPVHVVPLKDLVSGEWAENDPALRKDFKLSEAVAIKQAIEAKLAPAARARQLGFKPRGGKNAAEHFSGAGKSGDRAAAFTGKSRRTLEKAEAVVEAAERAPEKFGRLKTDMDRSGRVDGPFKRLKVMLAAEAIRNEPPPLPGNGPYRGVVIDFPWAAEPDNDDPERAARGYYPYPTMSLKDMTAYARDRIAPILHADCLIGLWITNYHLVLGHQVPILEALGATGVTIRTWAKDRMGRGQTFRGQTEHCVIARRGQPPLVVDNLTTLFHAASDKRRHSLKPQKFYDDFERLVAAPRYASLFETAHRGPNWDGHGDQMPAPEAGIKVGTDAAPRRAVAPLASEAAA
jgi:N6-adenosine-specific RNA methylase IME4/ParB-like chromosome segregation protein Spo0J